MIIIYNLEAHLNCLFACVDLRIFDFVKHVSTDMVAKIEILVYNIYV